MDDQRLYQKALAFAAQKHRGQFRIGGAPYITHPVAVAEILEKEGCGTETVVTGLFHDLLEDTDAKESEIEAVKGVDRLHNLRCAVLCGESFRRRYVSESKLWYWDFHPLIPEAIGELEKTLEK